MNELRKQLIEIVDSGEAYPEETVDRVVDAVIAALPFASADDEDGYVTAISEVTSILEKAKESK